MGTYDKLSSPFQDGSSNKYLSRKMIEGFEAAEIILDFPRHSLTIIQGSWNLGVSQSGGTHDRSGVADLSSTDRKMWVLRTLGFPGWHRRTWEGDWGDHLHVLTNGDPYMAPLALQQNSAYLDGYNGLGYRGRAGSDPFRRPPEPDVQFIQGASKKRWVAIRNTQGKTSAAGDPKDDAYRAAGWVWPEANIAQVKVDDRAWLVSRTGTFYRKADFQTFIARDERWEVIEAPAYRRLAPGPNAPKNTNVGPMALGNTFDSVGYCVLGGVKYVQTSGDSWITGTSLKEIEPEPTPVPEAA